VFLSALGPYAIYIYIYIYSFYNLNNVTERKHVSLVWIGLGITALLRCTAKQNTIAAWQHRRPETVRADYVTRQQSLGTASGFQDLLEYGKIIDRNLLVTK
jgi:hypothetical protein